jgi:hypothetical protein
MTPLCGWVRQANLTSSPVRRWLCQRQDVRVAWTLVIVHCGKPHTLRTLKLHIKGLYLLHDSHNHKQGIGNLSQRKEKRWTTGYASQRHVIASQHQPRLGSNGVRSHRSSALTTHPFISRRRGLVVALAALPVTQDVHWYCLLASSTMLLLTRHVVRRLARWRDHTLISSSQL